jgi:thiol-disulfide isomerase/thioredoxin
LVKAAGVPVAASQSTQPTGLPAEIVPASPNARLVAARTLSLYSNQFLIKFDEVPMFGSRDAPQVIVCLLDYTCTHCRDLHPILEKLSEQFSNQLGIVCLPVSLSPKCNQFIPVNSQANPDACEYARMALAVWRARPEAHRQFDDWLFNGVKVPPVDQAREYAAQLVGADKLNSALADPWVAQQILTDSKIHRANWLAVDDSSMPQIVLGNAVSSGPINSVEHLQTLLRQYLGLDLFGKGL